MQDGAVHLQRVFVLEEPVREGLVGQQGQAESWAADACYSQVPVTDPDGSLPLTANTKADAQVV